MRRASSEGADPPGYLKAAAEALIREEVDGFRGGSGGGGGGGLLTPGAAAIATSAVSASLSPPLFIRIAPVLDPEPVRVFEGHSEDVLDVAWSRGDMLLSASVDG
jgi:hypothetical protein